MNRTNKYIYNKFPKRSAYRSGILVSVVLILCFFLCVDSKSTKIVLLLRHADKNHPGTSYNLNRAGLQRALSIGTMIPGCYGTPTDIFVYPFDLKHDSGSRSYQTSVPLAVNTQVDITYAEGGEADPVSFGKKVRKLSADDCPLSVIFWRHSQIPAIAEGLGYKDMEELKENDFDTFYAFKYSLSDVPDVETLSEYNFFGMPCATNITHV